MNQQKNLFGISTALFTGNHSFTLEAIEECMAYNVEVLEITSDHVTGEYDEILTEIQQKYPQLKFWSIHLPFGAGIDISTLDDEQRKKLLNEMEKIIQKYQSYGVQKVIVHPCTEAFPPEERMERLKKAVQSIDYLTQVCTSNGMSLVVECLPRQCLGNCIEEMQFLLSNKETQMCYDTNHITLNTPTEVIEALGSRITTCHLADFDGVNEKHWEPYKGVLPFNTMMRQLTELGYTGPLMFEVIDRGGDYTVSVASLAKCYEKLIGIAD